MSSTVESKVPVPLFLSGGGEMGALIRSTDWSQTSLGGPDQWPQSLRVAVSIMLNTTFGMCIAWGKEFIQLYNDGFKPIIGARNPQALGIGARYTFEEVWHIIGPMFDGVMQGKAVDFPNFMLPRERNGYIEECYFDFSYSPIRLDNGQVGGVLVTLIETTKKVNSLKRLEEDKEQLLFALDAAELATWDYFPLTNTFTANKRYEEWFGISANVEINNELAISVIVEKDRQRVLDALSRCLDFLSGGRFNIEYTIQPPLRKKRMLRARGRAWFNEEQIAYRLSGTLQDVTEEISSRRSLIQSENNLRNIVMQAPVAMCVLKGADYIVEIANEAMMNLWGTAMENVIHKPLFVGRPEARGQGLEPLLDKVYLTGERFSAYEWPVKLPRNGKTQPVYINFVYEALKEGDGTISGIMAVANDVTDQVLARKKIEESEQRFRTLITEATVATGLYIGREIRIQYVNDIMIRYWGKDESVIGKTMKEAIPELEGQPFHQLLDRVYTTGEMYRGEESRADLIVNGNLKTMYFNFTYKALRDTEGNIYGIHHTSIDVTDKVIAKRTLQKNETNLRSLIMQAPVGICIVQGEPYYVEVVNDSFLDLVGKSRKEFEQKPYWTVLEEAAEHYAPILSEVAKTGVPFNGKEHEIMFIRNGKEEIVYVDFVFEPIKDPDAMVSRIMIIAIEITDKVLARKKIEESEQRFRTLAETLPQLIWMTDEHGTQQYASNRWEEFTGIQPSGAETWTRIVHPVDMQKIAQAWNESKTTGKVYNAEARLKNKYGDYRWHYVQGEPIRNEDGHIVKWIGAFTDIHDQKTVTEKLESLVNDRTAALQRSNEDLQQFAHVASHDLKEPLRKIKTFTNRLEDDHDTILSVKSKVYLEKVQSASDRLFSMIDGVLKYSMVDAHEQPVEQVDLNKTIEFIENDLELVIQNHSAVFEYDQLHHIEGSSVLIYQLLYNLINNSLKFANPTEQLRICISSKSVEQWEKNFIEISIKDNGIGFDQEQSEKIFNTFTRLHSKDKYEGTGLGLALCKKIVQRHHGAISAKGCKNQGAEFIILLPPKQVTNHI
ncbi:MAG: PAS domain S-box protein [Chitinophagaceae bacterium]|nr:PAS domain S-box protein [Chitinophagaceae bacterium]